MPLCCSDAAAMADLCRTCVQLDGSSRGIAKAKAAGVYRGRKPSIDQAQVEKLRAEGLGATEIAKRLNIGRASVYRVLAS
jgi:DNA invertase Pin-like site-specific DNA recombinase